MFYIRAPLTWFRCSYLDIYVSNNPLMYLCCEAYGINWLKLGSKVPAFFRLCGAYSWRKKWKPRNAFHALFWANLYHLSNMCSLNSLVFYVVSDTLWTRCYFHLRWYNFVNILVIWYLILESFQDNQIQVCMINLFCLDCCSLEKLQ